VPQSERQVRIYAGSEEICTERASTQGLGALEQIGISLSDDAGGNPLGTAPDERVDKRQHKSCLAPLRPTSNDMYDLPGSVSTHGDARFVMDICGESRQTHLVSCAIDPKLSKVGLMRNAQPRKIFAGVTGLVWSLACAWGLSRAQK